MTASPRPNLGGLFNGSAPPERSSSIADALGPRGVRLSAVADDTESERPAIGAPKRSSATDQRRIGPASPPTKTAPTAQDLHWPAPSWLDPKTTTLTLPARRALTRLAYSSVLAASSEPGSPT